MVAGCSVAKNATVNLVIANGHAYAVMSKQAIKHFSAIRPLQVAAECKYCDPCTFLRSEKAYRIQKLVSPNNPALRGANCYLPELGIRIASSEVMDMPLGDLNQKTFVPMAKVNQAISLAAKEHPNSSQSHIVPTPTGHILTGACV